MELLDMFIKMWENSIREIRIHAIEESSTFHVCIVKRDGTAIERTYNPSEMLDMVLQITLLQEIHSAISALEEGQPNGNSRQT